MSFNNNFHEHFRTSSTSAKFTDIYSLSQSLNHNLSYSSFLNSVFLRYGNRPPYPYTVFQDIYQSNSYLPYQLPSSNNIVAQSLVAEKTDFSIDLYLQCLRQSIITDRKNKVIFLSSGWDSTAILALLVEKYGPKDIICITLRMAYHKSKQNIYSNPYEIEKVKAFADYFNVKQIFVDSDFNNDEKDLTNRINKLSVNSLYNVTAFNHQTLWNACESLGLDAEDTAVYAGEFSDGAHNWGFSQYMSTQHPDLGLRQYADKVRCYFMSPEFLKRVYANDFSLKTDFLTSWLLPNSLSFPKKHITETQFIQNYLSNLFFLDSRGPYLPLSHPYLDQGKTNASLEIFAESVVLPNLCSSLETIYSSYIALYRYTHWMSSTVHGLRVFAPKGYELIMPFGDESVLTLLSSMPTEFGRGLELRPTKYPLKKILKSFIDYPYKIQDGKHAYIYDDNQQINLCDPLLENSNFYDLLFTFYLNSTNSALCDALPYMAEIINNLSKDRTMRTCLTTAQVTAFLLLNHQANLLHVKK